MTFTTTQVAQIQQSLPMAMGVGAARGMVGGAGAAAEPFDLASRMQRGAILDFYQRGQEEKDDEGHVSYMRDIVTSKLSPAVQMDFLRTAQAQRKGLEVDWDRLLTHAPPADNVFSQFQGAANKYIADNLPRDPAYDESMLVDIAEAGGGMATSVGIRMIPGIGWVSAGAYLGLMGSGQAIERAAANGANDEAQQRAALLGFGAGTLDLLPIDKLFKPFTRTKGFRGAMYGMAKKMVQQGLLEGSQEAISNFMQNGIAKMSDQHQALTEGMGYDAMLGAVIGSMFGAASIGRANTTKAFKPMLNGKPSFGGYPTAPEIVDQQSREFRTAREKVANLELSKYGPAEMQNLMKEVVETRGQVSSTALEEQSLDLFPDDPAFQQSRAGGREGAQGATVPIEITNRLAEEIGMDPALLGPILSREFGSALNAESIQALRLFVAKSGQQMFDTAASYRENKTSANFAEAKLAHQRFEAVLENLSGATAEAGRALRQLREPVAGGEFGQAAEIFLKDKGIDPDGDIEAQYREMFELMTQLETPGQVANFIAQGDPSKPGFGDKAAEYYVNALLSGGQTHVVNVASNALTAVNSVWETSLAGGLTVFNNKQDKVFLREATSRAYGMMAGTWDGLKAMGRLAVNEDAQGFEQLTKDDRRFKKSIGGKLGKVVRFPTRMLAAEDAFFKAVGYRMEVQQLTKRMAIQRGLKGKEHRDFMKKMPQIMVEMNKAKKEAKKQGIFAVDETDDFVLEYLDNKGLTVHPTDLAQFEKIHLDSEDAAHYQTFTRDLGKTGKAGLTYVNTHPAFKFVLPFVRTPVNLFKFAGERTVGSLISPKVRALLLKKNANISRQDAARQRAKILNGSIIMTSAFMLAEQGLITGSGPSDPDEKATWYDMGWQPNSILMGDKWVSYSRIEPMGTLFGFAANMAQWHHNLDDKQQDEMIGAFMTTMVDNMVSKTWMQGPADTAQALADPERYGAAWMQKWVGSMVPTGIAHAARVEDPVFREINKGFEGFGDAVINRWPGASQNLAANMKWDGTPISFSQGAEPEGAFEYFLDWVNPFYTSKKTSPDQLTSEMMKLRMGVKKPDSEIEGVDLLDLPGGQRMYEQYVKLAGKWGRQRANLSIDIGKKSGKWRALTSDERKADILKRINDARGDAEDVMKAKYPLLIKMIEATKVRNKLQDRFNRGFKDPLTENLFGDQVKP